MLCLLVWRRVTRGNAFMAMACCTMLKAPVISAWLQRHAGGHVGCMGRTKEGTSNQEWGGRDEHECTNHTPNLHFFSSAPCIHLAMMAAPVARTTTGHSTGVGTDSQKAAAALAGLTGGGEIGAQAGGRLQDLTAWSPVLRTDADQPLATSGGPTQGAP